VAFFCALSPKTNPKIGFALLGIVCTFAARQTGVNSVCRKRAKTYPVDSLSYKTVSINKQNADKQWVVVDAADQILGRFSSKVAKLLRGKYKPSFTPHVDCGDNVIVINAEKIKLTGNKWTEKSYIRHTGYPGGQRSLTATELFEKDPTRVVEKAIKGMLPKNKLGAELFRNLYVIAGDAHNHGGQQPTVLNINELS
jgi:large subunit ribosomal protein L13